MDYAWRMPGAVICFLFLHTLSWAVIHSTETPAIGGIRQFIKIDGTNEKNPVLLFLHGGPGNSVLGYSQDFTGELQKRFIVVQWDQRETGKTKKLNSSPLPLTVSLFENDAVEIINFLRKRFSKEKIYLIGHSWGGFLGLLVASKHAELLHGYFAISPMVWQDESERQTLMIMKANASRDGNEQEIAELDKVNIPFKTGLDLYYHRKWLTHLMGQKSFAQTYVERWAVTWLPVFREASAFNFFEVAPEIQCPVYFLLGDHDYQTYYKLTAQYFEKLKSPGKVVFWFPGAAHSFLSSQQKKLQEIIIRQLPDKSN